VKHHVGILGSLPLIVLGLHAVSGCTETSTVTPPRDTREAKVIVCAPGSFTNGVECLPVKQPQCPAGTMPEDGQCVAQPSTSTRADREQALQAAVAESEPELADVLDSRIAQRTPRARALVISDVQALESLFASMAKTAPDRPKLMRRLAERYVELSASAARDSARAPDAAERAKGDKIAVAARQSAIKYYKLLTQQYPLFCSTTGGSAGVSDGGCADEALYYLALEHVRGDATHESRKTLLNLVQNWPQSLYIGQAYFLFGEMFRKEAASDPSKWALAEQSYAEAAKYPKSPVAALALTRRKEARQKGAGGGGSGPSGGW